MRPIKVRATILAKEYDLNSNYFHSMRAVNNDKFLKIFPSGYTNREEAAAYVDYLENLRIKAQKHYYTFSSDYAYGKWLVNKGLTKSKKFSIGRAAGITLFSTCKNYPFGLRYNSILQLERLINAM